jgi:hypothetical protein
MDSFLKHQLEHPQNTVEATPISGRRIVLAIKTGQVIQAQAVLDVIRANRLIDRLASVVRENSP